MYHGTEAICRKGIDGLRLGKRSTTPFWNDYSIQNTLQNYDDYL